MVSEFNTNNCEVLLLKLNRNISSLKFMKTLRNVFKKNNPELVHVQYMAPGMLPIVAARLAGVKKVLATVHQPYTRSHGIKAKLFLRFSSMLCKHIIVVSKNAEISWFGSGIEFSEIPENKKLPKHFTIYNAIDVKRLNSIKNNVDVLKERQKLKTNKDSLIFGMVSRLSPEKGIDIALEAFKRVIKEKYDAHLLIVGGGNEEDKLKEMFKALKISENVTFYGETNWADAMKQMALMDVVIVPSRFEGFGLSAAEAMAMCKPVLASDVFGLKEVVIDKKTGLTFTSENVIDLTQQLLKLLNNPEMLKKLGDTGFEHATLKFSTKVFKTKINKLYTKFLVNE
jgi:glycosyltransferase involved in cell wall biosynthesis